MLPEAELVAAKVTFCEAPGAIANEAGDAVTEEGKPETVTVTVELKPPEAVTETLKLADALENKVTEVGDTEIEKSPCGVELSTAVDDVLVPPEPSPQLASNPKNTNKVNKQAREPPQGIRTR